MHVYLVGPGDTREKIAERFRVPKEVLDRCNALPPVPFLLPGLSLAIPSELEFTGTAGFRTYQVQAGDTLRQLSARFGIPATWISFCNSLTEPILQPGEYLLLPYTQHFTHATWRAQAATQILELFQMATIEGTVLSGVPGTYRGLQGLQVDAAGRLHFPAPTPLQSEKRLFLCTLSGSDHILPDVAKAILQSDHAKQQILDSMSAQLRAQAGDGVIFAWQGLRPEWYDAYLSFVQEAGRRLRPMGLVVSLYLRSDSPLLKKTKRLGLVADQVDHFFFDPIAEPETVARSSLQRQAPPPLIGVAEAEKAMHLAASVLPEDRLWLVLHPVGLLTRQGQVVATLSPQQALEIAYTQGAPLIREPDSELVFARCQRGGDGESVWMEDLWSLARKVERLVERGWQGLALWEADLAFPQAWSFLRAKRED